MIVKQVSFSNDVMTAMLLEQSKEMAAMLVDKNKKTTAMLIDLNNPRGIKFYFFSK